MASAGSADADVVVVGAGPGGSAAAHALAQSGLDVLLLEKTCFPREKVCGDGLTPRAVKSLVDLGIDTSEANGFIRNHGLRIIGGGMRLELPWPDLATYPDFGLVRPRLDFDELLVRHAQKAGARLQELTTVTGPVLDERGRVVGVTAKVGPGKVETTYRAPLVVAADGGQEPGFQVHLGGGLASVDRDEPGLGRTVRGLKVTAVELPEYVERVVRRWSEQGQEGETFATWAHRVEEGQLL